MTRTPPGYIPLTSHSLSGFSSGQNQGGDRPRSNRGPRQGSDRDNRDGGNGGQNRRGRSNRPQGAGRPNNRRG